MYKYVKSTSVSQIKFVFPCRVILIVSNFTMFIKIVQGDIFILTNFYYQGLFDLLQLFFLTSGPKSGKHNYMLENMQKKCEIFERKRSVNRLF